VGVISVGQVVALQVAAALVFVGLRFGPIGLAAGGVLALVLLVVAFVPVSGRCLFEAVVLRWELAGRRRRRPRPDVEDPRLRALTELAPALIVHDVIDRMNRVGVGSDGDGWFAAIAIANPVGLRAVSSPGLPLDALAKVLVDGGVRGVRIQLVSHAVPAPTAQLPAASPAASSYRQLPGVAGGAIAAQRHSWLAVRLPAAAAAEAAATRGGGSDGVGRALAATVGRLAKVFAAAGIDHRVLDAPALLDALARCSGVDTASPTADRRFDEHWDQITVGGLAYRSLAVVRWPDQRPGEPGLIAQLARIPGAVTTVALAIDDPTEGTAGIRTILRIAAPPALLPAAVDAALEVSRQAGAKLRPLYGEQAAGMYATAPTAGGLR
jgi:type VII secretion protein EccE